MSRKGTKPGAVAEKRTPGNASSFADREREALKTLGKVPEAPVNGSPDTVKLSSQTWQPPPRKAPEPTKLEPASWKNAAATVKVEAGTWRDASNEEDAVTDVRDAVDVEEPVAVTGEATPHVAGEIGTDDDAAVRIISVPPSDLAATPAPAPVRLPGMPARQPPPMETAPVAKIPSPPMSTMRSPAVPMPDVRSPTPPPVARDATPPPMRDATPAPRAPFHADLTPPPRPMPRTVDPTMILRIQRGPTRAIIVTAVLASAIGLGTGYLIWGAGLGGDAKNAASETEAAKPAPAVVAPKVEKCELKVGSVPKGAAVVLDGKPLGETPVNATIPCDSKELTVKKRRFSDVVQEVKPKDGKTIELNLELERPTFAVTIKSNPAGGSIYIDGVDVGKTPTKVSVPGFTRTKVVIKKDGYRDTNGNIFAKRKSATVSYRLKRKRR